MENKKSNSRKRGKRKAATRGKVTNVEKITNEKNNEEMNDNDQENVKERLNPDEVNANEMDNENSNKIKRKRLMKKSETDIEPESNNTSVETDNAVDKKPAKPSKRQLKKEKAEIRETRKKDASKREATIKALNYVSKWKHARSEWKFEKIRQIWLIDHLLDEDCIPDDIFPTVLEYFGGCKGMAREKLLKKGMDIIRKSEDNEENQDEIMETTDYKRARQLLQALPIEVEHYI